MVLSEEKPFPKPWYLLDKTVLKGIGICCLFSLFEAGSPKMVPSEEEKEVLSYLLEDKMLP